MWPSNLPDTHVPWSYMSKLPDTLHGSVCHIFARLMLLGLAHQTFLILTFLGPAPAGDGTLVPEEGHVPGGETDCVDHTSVLLEVQWFPQLDQSYVVVPGLGVKILEEGNNVSYEVIN